MLTEASRTAVPRERKCQAREKGTKAREREKKKRSTLDSGQRLKVILVDANIEAA
jgi:hypothetical protein